MAELETGSTVQYEDGLPGTTVTDAPAPARIGRYLVEGTLGRGGMGIVFAAFDPRLDRRVALKLLRADRSRVLRDDEWRRRLLAEARALAQLSDPNVVQVFDLGPHEGGVYVAMELVDGCTLSEWLKERPRTLAEILPVFVAAGHGLAAAHAVGIVHRDFKPGNVLLGSDGRVRVADFGLAAACSSSASDVATPASSEITGAFVMGTVGYMAPEQRRAQPTDHRADQYSFCVALHAAIYGEKPEQTEQGDALVCSRTHPPVPARIRAAMQRGLRTDPAERFVSMHALLGALERRSVPARWMIACTVAIVPFAVVGALAAAPEPPAQGCRSAAERLAGVWDPQVRAAVTSGFAATGNAYASEASPRVVEAVDAWTTAWTAEYEAACAAASESPVRIDCLSVELDRLRALTDVLRAPDERVVVRAQQSVQNLRAPQECAAPDAIGEPPAELAAEVAATYAAMNDAKAQFAAGRFDEARAAALRAVGDAEVLDWPPLRAEALFFLGVVEQERQRPDEGKAALEQAFWLARQCGHEKIAMQAAAHMIELVGIDLREFDEALRWARETESAIARYGGDTSTEIALLVNRASVFDMVGRQQEARADLERALALRASVPGLRGSGASAHNSLGIVAFNVGDDAAGFAHLEKAIEITERELGPEHPEMALYLMNLGASHLQRKAFAKGRPLIQRAFEIRQRAYGIDSPATAHALGLLGVAADLAGERTEALAILEKVLAIRERVLPPDHPELANTYNSLAVVLEGLGRREEAFQHQLTALAMLERRLGDSNPDLAQLHVNLGEFAFQDRQWKLAEEHLRRAIEMRETAVGPTHRSLADPLYSLAEVMLEQGRAAEAVQLAERSLAAAPPDDLPERHHMREKLLARAKARAR